MKSSSILATWCGKPTHRKRPWCWKRLRAGGEGDGRQRIRWLDVIIGLNGQAFEQTPGVGEGQGSLACCSPWDAKELDTTEWLNNKNKGAAYKEKRTWSFWHRKENDQEIRVSQLRSFQNFLPLLAHCCSVAWSFLIVTPWTVAHQASHSEKYCFPLTQNSHMYVSCSVSVETKILWKSLL